VPKIRLGGYIFLARRSDHPPRHVHVYRERDPGREVGLENKKPMKGKAPAALLRPIEELESDGRL